MKMSKFTTTPTTQTTSTTTLTITDNGQIVIWKAHLSLRLRISIHKKSYVYDHTYDFLWIDRYPGELKIHRRNLKVFFSRSTEPILTKLGTKHSWVMRTHVCSNKGPNFFSKGDNYEMTKSPEPLGQFQTKLAVIVFISMYGNSIEAVSLVSVLLRCSSSIKWTHFKIIQNCMI